MVKPEQRQSKGSEQLQIIEPAEQAEERADGAGPKEHTTHMPEEGGGSSRTSDYNAIDQYDANLGTVSSETAATLTFGRPSAYPLAGNPGTMSTELSGVLDVQTRRLAPKPTGNPSDISAMSEFPTMGVQRQDSPAADLLIPGKMFREMEAGWYQRVRDLEADLHRRYAELEADLHRRHTDQEADLHQRHADLEADLQRRHEKSSKKLYKGMERRSVEITRLTVSCPLLIFFQCLTSILYRV
ncbi:hypothetical protein HOY82DRAFT_618935 [Tuber indicum]|nr:hypothetical protein HOY82DRAFT_618935 [Tuber indicum]